MTDEANVVPVVEAVADTTNKDVIDPNEFSALKEEVERLREHKVKYEADQKAKADKLKADVDKAAREKAEAEGNYKELLALKEKEFADKAQEYESKLTAFQQAELTNKINTAAGDVAKQLTQHANKAADLTEKLAKMIKLTDEGIVIVDKNGKVVSDNVNYLAEFAKKNYDYLCDGLQSTGTAGLVIKPTGKKEINNMDPGDMLNAAFGIN